MMSIVYTSGTTGPSKGVMTTQRHAFRYASTVLEALDMEHDDVVYTCGMPLFHVAAKWGAGYASLIKGATLAIPKKFSLGGFWSDVRMYGATITVLPGVVASLLYSQPRSPDDARSTLKKACMVPLIPEFEDFKARFGMRISMAYGSTECGCPTIHPMDEAVTDRRSVGVLKSELYEMAIFDDQDNEVAPGEIGEIVLRSKEPWIMMLGYWNRPEATVEAWRNLWFHSGDAGFKDKAGRFYFVDRIKDCIRRRGENISSSEVEGIVRQLSGVLECAVYPVPSELTEDEIMVAIIPAPGADLDPADLIDSLKDMMPRFMVPRYVEILDALPKTETGKIKKQELTDRGVKITTWDHES
jgi:crotonobetaine/carnitine-CoA ligase